MRRKRRGRASPVVSRQLSAGVVGGIGLVVLLLAVVIGYRAAYAGKIYPGVRIDGVPVGGLTPAQAQSTLQVQLQSSLQDPLVVRAGSQQWQLSRLALGAHYDWQGLAATAYDVGRTGSPVDQLVSPLVVRIAPRNVGASVALGTADWAAVLAPIARQLDHPAVDASLSVTSDHTVQLRPDHSGTQLDEVRAKRLIAAALVSAATNPVQLPVSPVAPTVPAAALQEARSQATAFLSGPVSLNYQGHTWTLGIDQLQAALAIPNVDGSGRLSPLDVKQATLDQVVGQVARDLNRPVQNAELVLQDGKVVVVPEQSGREVDVVATEGLVRKALASNHRTVTPVIQELTPTVKAADWVPAVTVANRLIGSAIVVNGPGNQSWKLSPASLQKMLVLPKQPSNSQLARPQLDPAKLSAFVASVAKDVDRDPVNARFQLASGKVTLLKPGLDGLKVDQRSTMAAIQTAASSSDRSVSLSATSVPPSVGADEAAKLSGLQLVADNSTSYVGSIPPRRHNVELATALLNGVVVPPGATFSFNRELGPASLDRGFQVGYGIEAQGDIVKTVPSVAGGICQVATTLFQPIFWTGYEIESRYAHAYFIAHYVSHGDPGLDSTVDDEAGLDFQFKNDTLSDLLIQSSTDGSNVHFQVFGVQPTWKVKVDPPVISNFVKTDRTLQVQQDPTLPKGQQIYTEAAEDGFTVLVRRTVTDATQHTRVLDLRSVYEPAHNVMLVGTKTT